MAGRTRRVVWTRPAQEALDAELLNYVVPGAELDAKLDWLLGRILDKSPTAVRLGKMGFHAMQDIKAYFG